MFVRVSSRFSNNILVVGMNVCVHGALQSRVYFLLAPSVPELGFSSNRTLTRIKDMYDKGYESDVPEMLSYHHYNKSNK